MNRKQRRANKVPSLQIAKAPAKKYQITFAGSNPDDLSRKERAIILAMITQVPYAVSLVEQNPVPADEADPPFAFPHVHVVFNESRKVCLRWEEADTGRVVEGKCETL